jgi:hypothetical protein
MFFLFAISVTFLGVNTFLGGCFPLAIYRAKCPQGFTKRKEQPPVVGDCSFSDV